MKCIAINKINSNYDSAPNAKKNKGLNFMTVTKQQAKHEIQQIKTVGRVAI